MQARAVSNEITKLGFRKSDKRSRDIGHTLWILDKKKLDKMVLESAI